MNRVTVVGHSTRLNREGGSGPEGYRQRHAFPGAAMYTRGLS